jgi:3-hydroxyacyl-[acyl-carrier-protein] dehydratase
MLKDNLFKIVAIEQLVGCIVATLEINKDNMIFTGHFPNQPVLPGACMLQMVKEVLENTLNSSLQLKKAHQIKFLAIVNPQINNTLHLNLSYNYIANIVNVNVSLNSQAGVCFKLKGDFIQSNS